MIISGGQATLGFPPQALGEVVPSLSNGYYYATQSLGLLNQFASYSALYRKQPMIATVVDKVSASAARLSVKAWDTTPKTGRVQDIDSAYARLIANPSTTMSPFSFWRWTFSTYEIFGETFWYKQRESVDADGKPYGQITNLLPMHPSRTAVHRDNEGRMEYIFTLGVASAGILRAPASDVVAFLRYNPDNLMRGLSRLEPLNSTLLNEDAARRANRSFWDKGARPSVFLRHPGELSAGAHDRLRSDFDARHAGADNMGGTALLEEGMDATIIQLTSEEMQYIEGRKLNLQEACMVYDVPPPVIHILDHATYSNITEQMRSMYRDTMSPRLEDVESVIDFSLTSEFYQPGQRKTQFDMTDVLRGDFEGRATSVVALRNAGLATGNMGLEIMGFPRSLDPEMDRYYANAALVPLGTPAQRVSITEAVPPAPHQQLEASATQSGAQAASEAAKSLKLRDVLGRLGRMKALSKPDIRAAAVQEHQKALATFFDDQRASVKSSVKALDLSSADEDLAAILHTLSKATAQAIGAKVAADLGGEYSSDDIASWLETNSADTAKKINAATADEVTKAMEAAAEDASADDTVDGVFDGEVAARTDQISMSRVALVGGLASLVAARMSKAATKTWVSGSSGHPRSEHAAMNGETVPLGEPFSNGLSGPGDYSGGAEEVANCSCDMSFSTDGG